MTFGSLGPPLTEHAVNCEISPGAELLRKGRKETKEIKQEEEE